MRLMIALLTLLSFPVAHADDKYIATTDGKVTISCLCIAATSLCQSKLFDSLAGKERFDWAQEGFTKKGQRYNLNEACYRKRNVDGRGEGLCCEVPGDEKQTIKRMFRGTVN